MTDARGGSSILEITSWQRCRRMRGQKNVVGGVITPRDTERFYNKLVADAKTAFEQLENEYKPRLKRRSEVSAAMNTALCTKRTTHFTTF